MNFKQPKSAESVSVDDVAFDLSLKQAGLYMKEHNYNYRLGFRNWFKNFFNGINRWYCTFDPYTAKMYIRCRPHEILKIVPLLEKKFNCEFTIIFE